MEKKITTDDQPSSSSSTDSSRPSLKIRIRITPEMRKQLESWEKQQQRQEAVKEINVKSEPKKEVVVVVVPQVVVKESIEIHHQTKLQQLVNCSSSSSFELKLEATKRKFHDSYQQIANAKKQRRIQVIDPRNLPLQASGGGKGTSKLTGAADGCGCGAKSRILNVIQSKKKTNNKSRNNLVSASRGSTLLKSSYIC